MNKTFFIADKLKNYETNKLYIFEKYDIIV